VYQPNPGDTLMFIMMTDRIPILLGIIAVYFLGFRSTNLPITIAFLVTLIVPVVAPEGTVAVSRESELNAKDALVPWK
jgi:hypothetical protein